MSEGPERAPQLTALLPGVRAPVECEAKFVSYFDPVITQIFGERSFYCYFGVHRRRLIKNIMSLWASPVRKIVWALWIKKLLLLQRLVYTSGDLRLQFWFNTKKWRRFSVFQEYSRTRPWGSNKRYGPGHVMWTSTPAIHPHLHIIRFLVWLLGLVRAN
jgi:hypothetical protein